MLSEDKNYEQIQLEKKLDELTKKLDQVTSKLDHLERQTYQNRGSIGHNIWVLIPVTAIIMWGLREIFAR
jgi:tetrahydromethanopterin S-methyltransferase subunit G